MAFTVQFRQRVFGIYRICIWHFKTVFIVEFYKTGYRNTKSSFSLKFLWFEHNSIFQHFMALGWSIISTFQLYKKGLNDEWWKTTFNIFGFGIWCYSSFNGSIEHWNLTLNSLIEHYSHFNSSFKHHSSFYSITPVSHSLREINFSFDLFQLIHLIDSSLMLYILINCFLIAFTSLIRQRYSVFDIPNRYFICFL